MWRIEGDRVRPLAGEYGAWWPDISGTQGHMVELPEGLAWIEPLPDNSGVWVQLGPDDSDTDARPVRARAAAAVLAEIFRGEKEAGQVAAELATRYEEIDLLYTIADILGRTVKLEEAAQTIAREVADVVGARRASIMVYDEVTRALRMVAGRGLETYDIEPVPIDDPDSIAAHVFRERTMLSFDRGTPGPHPGTGVARGYKGRSFLALPIIYAPPGGEPHPVGVINLTDRIGDDVFTAGHKKLLTAIANQVGAAIENARLIEGERRRVRLDTELLMARDLQSALMQPQAAMPKGADIGARTRSAETVGGDFYKFLGQRDSIGLLVGDVSSHGLSAAMLMAHVIAAAGIVASERRSPELVLRRLLEVVGGELVRAEMHVALFYAILEPRRGVLRYANAGHPHAFIMHDDGRYERLGATAPPLGLQGNAKIRGEKVVWAVGDMMCVFTDGFSEASNAAGARYSEDRLLSLVAENRSQSAVAIVDAAFDDIETFAISPAEDDRTLVIVRG